MPSPASGSCNVVDPLSEKIGSFQATGEIVILVNESLVPVLEHPTCQVRLGSGSASDREGTGTPTIAVALPQALIGSSRNGDNHVR